MKETLLQVSTQSSNPPPDDRMVDCTGERVADVTPLERERLLSLAARVTWERGDAEDAVQEALLTAHEKSDQLRDPGKRWAWLCRIVIQQCYEQARQARRRARHFEAFSAQTSRTTVQSDRSQLKDLKEVIRRAIVDLSPRQQQVLVLKDLEGMSYDEVAAVLQVSATTARVHSMGAREALRAWISQNCPEMFP